MLNLSDDVFRTPADFWKGAFAKTVNRLKVYRRHIENKFTYFYEKINVSVFKFILLIVVRNIDNKKNIMRLSYDFFMRPLLSHFIEIKSKIFVQFVKADMKILLVTFFIKKEINFASSIYVTFALKKMTVELYIFDITFLCPLFNLRWLHSSSFVKLSVQFKF